MFVYNTRSQPGQLAFDETNPDFEAVSIALSGVVNSLPTEFALAQNYPNPFNPTTEINFDLPKNAHVELSVFNILGQSVTTLVSGEMPAGSHQISWNGTDSDGGSVASGIYFYRISAGDYSSSKKMMLLK